MGLAHLPTPRGPRKPSVSKAAKWQKRASTRLRRLAEKRDPENAPSKPAFIGYP